jgi:predicted nucleotidyltransferase
VTKTYQRNEGAHQIRKQGVLEALGSAIANQRTALGMSQAGLATLIGSHHSQISRIETGQHVPTVDMLARIAMAFGSDLVLGLQPGELYRLRGDRGLTLMDLGDKKSELRAVADAHGATNLRVFGSVARGEATSKSDVDFIVRLKPNWTPSDLSQLILDFEKVLGVHVNVVDEVAHKKFVQSVAAEAVAL